MAPRQTSAGSRNKLPILFRVLGQTGQNALIRADEAKYTIGMMKRILNLVDLSCTPGGTSFCNSVPIAQIQTNVPTAKNNIISGNSFRDNSTSFIVKTVIK